jgi:hypothetical protein
MSADDDEYVILKKRINRPLKLTPPKPGDDCYQTPEEVPDVICEKLLKHITGFCESRARSQIWIWPTPFHASTLPRRYLIAGSCRDGVDGSLKNLSSRARPGTQCVTSLGSGLRKTDNGRLLSILCRSNEFLKGFAPYQYSRVGIDIDVRRHIQHEPIERFHIANHL